MGLLNGAPTFLGQFGAYFVLFFFYCWLAFVFGENRRVPEKIWLAGVPGGEVGIVDPGVTHQNQ